MKSHYENGVFVTKTYIEKAPILQPIDHDTDTTSSGYEYDLLVPAGARYTLRGMSLWANNNIDMYVMLQYPQFSVSVGLKNAISTKYLAFFANGGITVPEGWRIKAFYENATVNTLCVTNILYEKEVV